MKHDFNHKAETFDSPKNIFLANLVCQAIEKQIDFLSDKEILDFGGGTGLLALPLAKQAKSVTLVDISEKMLEQARLKAEQQDIKNIQFLNQDLLANPLGQQFDLIIVSRVLHHMPDLDATLACSTVILGRGDKFSLLILSRQMPTTTDLSWLNWKTSLLNLVFRALTVRFCTVQKVFS